MGIEPTSQPWEGRILPMNYIRAITETQYRRFIQEKQDWKNTKKYRHIDMFHVDKEYGTQV